MAGLRLLTVLSLVSIVCAATVKDKNKSRIVGGDEVSIQEVPFQCSVMEHGHHVCGCTILSETHVLSAAHCLEDVNPNSHDLKIRAGSSTHENGGVVKDVVAFKVHKSYDAETMDSDVAVFKTKPFVFSNSIKKCKIASDIPKDGSPAFVSGWGLIKNNGDLSPNLKKASLTVMSQEKCTQTGYGKHISKNMFCARGKGTDACEGDSGGPIVNDQSELIGIISFGFDCASEKYPGVYVLVYEFLSFIKEAMKTL